MTEDSDKPIDATSTPVVLQAPDVFDEASLLSTPVQRAAYSDRTAWLMSAMSELAYFHFEGVLDFDRLVESLASMTGKSDIESRLRQFLKEIDADGEDGRNALAFCLNEAGFELVNVYNIADCQAFLAKREANDSGGGIRVLAFRGTEKKLADFKTDLKAELYQAPEASPGELIHKGFYEAFTAVRPQIVEDLKKDPGLPLYLTGHSLGGALAVVATRFIGKDSLGACYTFGSPRVGNLNMCLAFRTPIYRIVNSSDIVPRVPPAWILTPLLALFKWLPVPDLITQFVEKFQGYMHFGDMRYLNHVNPNEKAEFPGLRLIANPSLPLRASWVIKRWIASMGRSGLEDHSISLYRRKLKAYALSRK